MIRQGKSMGRKTPHFEEILEQFVRIVNKYNALERHPLDYGCGENLYPSEIHAIEAIGKHPDVHMAEIANVLGVTRGAVQQTAGKLLKKGLVEKLMDENDRKRVYLSLTPKGKIAYQGHEEYHAELSSSLAEHFRGLQPTETASLKDFFTRVESFMDVYDAEKMQQRRQPR
jgi:DNA-binding MarR family transcriptional regulator